MSQFHVSCLILLLCTFSKNVYSNNDTSNPPPPPPPPSPSPGPDPCPNETDIRNRTFQSVECDDYFWKRPNYERNYCEKPFPIGLGIRINTQPAPPANKSFVHISAKFVDIPDDGYVTEFMCMVENPTVPAWFGVLRPINNITNDPNETTVVCSEISLGEGPVNGRRGPITDRVPLSEPCAVKKGDYLAYAGPSGLQRCSATNIGPGFLLEKTFDNDNIQLNLMNGVNFTNTNSTSNISLTPAFQAIFECGCKLPLIGDKLIDNGNMADVDDVIYYSSEIIPEGTILSGLAIYTENPDDNTTILSVVSVNNSNRRFDFDEEVLCPQWMPNGTTVGVEQFTFPNGPCQVMEPALLKLSTHSRTERKDRNRVGYTIVDPHMCGLEVNGREDLCDRKYSIAAVEKCYSSFGFDKWPEIDGIISPGANQTYQQSICGLDYTANKTFGNFFKHNSEDIEGPAIYIDLHNPLDDGIVSAWEYVITDYNQHSDIFPVVWRKSEIGHFQYEIVCYGYSENTQMTPIVKTYTDNSCFVKKGDFVGFIFTGQNQIPLAHEDETNDPNDYLTLLDETNLLTIDSPRVNGTYTMTDATVGKKFAIKIELCTVGMDSTLNTSIDYEMWENNQDPKKGTISNLLYKRQYVTFESETVIDMLNVIPFDGFVTDFYGYGSNCADIDSSDEVPIFVMLRPTNSDVTSFEVICSARAPLCDNQSMYINVSLGSSCPVQFGDFMGVILGNADYQTISYDVVDNYPSFFLDRLFDIQENRTCNRKYSMGFEFRAKFYPEFFGSDLICRPHRLFDSEDIPQSFTYIDLDTTLPNGILGKYKIYAEGPADSITFFILSQSMEEQPDCTLIVNGEEIIPGNELTFDLPNANCLIDSTMTMGMMVNGSRNTFDFTCNPQFDSILINYTGPLWFKAEQCPDRMQLSLQAVTRDEDDAFDSMTPFEEEEEWAYYHEWSNDQCLECNVHNQPNFDIGNCNTHEKTFGVLYNMPDYIDMHSLMFVDLDIPLDAGILTHWSFEVHSPDSALMPAVWRQVDNTSFQLICKGYANDPNVLRNTVEDVYPVDVCNVKKGDYLGFVAFADDTGKLRIAAENLNMQRSFMSQYYPDFKKTSFVIDGIYSMFHAMGDVERVYSMQASICKPSGGSENCTYGRVVDHSPPLLNASMVTTIDMNVHAVTYVDTRNSLPQGSLFSWSYVVGHPSGKLYPVVWKKIDSKRFEIACYGYSRNSRIPMNSVVEVKPFGMCEIDSDQYYNGFVSDSHAQRVGYYADISANTKTVINYPEIDVSFWKMYHFMDMIPQNPLYNDHHSAAMSLEYETDRVYMIDAQICIDPESCLIHPYFNTGESESIARDRTVLYQQIENGSCISSLKLNAIQPRVTFDISIWKPSQTSSRTFTLVKNRNLMTERVGEQVLYFDHMCADSGDYIGFSFYDRRLPFFSSKNDKLDVNLTVVTPFSRKLEIGDSLEFFTSVSVGKMPIEICSRHNQLIGNYLPSQTDDDQLQSFYKQSVNSDKVRFSVFADHSTSQAIYSDIEFSAKLAKPGRIHFMLVKSSSIIFPNYKIEKVWTFDSDLTGAQTFSPIGPLPTLEENMMLAVAAEKDVILYAVNPQENSPEIYSAIVNLDMITPGKIIECDKTSAEPAAGMRLDL